MPKTGSLALVALLLWGCASRLDLGLPERLPPSAVRSELRAHAVAFATFSAPDGTALGTVVHLRLDGPTLRAHLGTDSGLTIADVEVRGGDTVVHRVSELGRQPGMVERITLDLRRLYGDRSVLAALAAGSDARTVSAPSGTGAPARVALPLAGGGWAVVPRDETTLAADALHVLLLDADRRPEATVDYLDVDAQGIARSLRLRDLRDGHTLTLDVESISIDPAEDRE